MSDIIEEIVKTLNNEVSELKKEIEIIEMLDNPSSPKKGLLVEQLIKKFVNVKVKMYKENHNRPHVHIDIGNSNHNASICIKTSEILVGSVKKKYLKIISNWIEKNRDNLLKVWNSMQEGSKLDLTKLS